MMKIIVYSMSIDTKSGRVKISKYETFVIKIVSTLCLNYKSLDDFANNDESSEMMLKEVVHCDGCHRVIEGLVMKCTDCFDFDLCEDCYPVVSKDHFSGCHKFVTEK